MKINLRLVTIAAVVAPCFTPIAPTDGSDLTKILHNKEVKKVIKVIEHLQPPDDNSTPTAERKSPPDERRKAHVPIVTYDTARPTPVAKVNPSTSKAVPVPTINPTVTYKTSTVKPAPKSTSISNGSKAVSVPTINPTVTYKTSTPTSASKSTSTSYKGKAVPMPKISPTTDIRSATRIPAAKLEDPETILQKTREAKSAFDAQKAADRQASTAERKAAKARERAAATQITAAAARQLVVKTKGNARNDAEKTATASENTAKQARDVANQANKEAIEARNNANIARTVTQIKTSAAGIGNLPLEKPPFTETPQGQKLSPNTPATDRIQVVSTRENPFYGAAGDVRTTKQGIKRHAGIDENKREQTKFTGMSSGVAHVQHSKYLGEMVTVEFTAADGTRWSQRSMHLRSISVKDGQKVAPGEVIGVGMGAGKIFEAPDAGPPHVHSEFRHNGRPVEPYSGLELPFNPTADIKERERAADRAAQKAKGAIKNGKPPNSSSSATQ